MRQGAEAALLFLSLEREKDKVVENNQVSNHAWTLLSPLDDNV